MRNWVPVVRAPRRGHVLPSRQVAVGVLAPHGLPCVLFLASCSDPHFNALSSHSVQLKADDANSAREIFVQQEAFSGTHAP